MRILLKIAYDGTNYQGFAKSNTGLGIEQVLNDKLTELLEENIEVMGLSRTDSGVHAKSNYVVFDTSVKVNPDKIYYAINDILPKDISVLSSKKVDDYFHPRKVDSIKTYRYNIYNNKIRDPLICHFAHHVYYDINTKKMIEASKYLIGEHCFKSFVNPDCQMFEGKTKEEKEIISTRVIYDITIKKDMDIISIIIRGNGFLYNMVRIICGTLLKVGMGMWDVGYVKEILDKKDRKYAGFTLPACGLVLDNVEFL